MGYMYCGPLKGSQTWASLNESHINSTNVHEIYYIYIIYVRPSSPWATELAAY